MSGPNQATVRPRAFRTLKLTSMLAQKFVTSPAAATCLATFTTTGDLGGDITLAHIDEYLDQQGTGAGAPYEIRYGSVTGDTGDLTGPALNTFHGLGTQRQWSLFKSGTPPGQRNVTGTITIREILKTSNSVAATLAMQALVDPDA